MVLSSWVRGGMKYGILGNDGKIVMPLFCAEMQCPPVSTLKRLMDITTKRILDFFMLGLNSYCDTFTTQQTFDSAPL